MKQKPHNFEIDLVYLWVDGSDPLWQEKRNDTLKKHHRPTVELKGRFENNDELKYSLRSAEKHVPWIRKIFIVTDNQVPEWLDTSHPKIKIIDHKEILPAEALPCFNSGVIEYFLYRIPGLSEHFLYANDDMFFNRNVSSDFFFKNDGLPYVRLAFKPFQKVESLYKKIFSLPINNHRRGVNNASRLIWKKKKRHFTGATHHNIDAYLKSDLKDIYENIYHDELNTILKHHFRSPLGIQRILISFHILATKRGHKRFVRRNESLRMRVHHKKIEDLYYKYNPALFCLNDTEHATDNDRKRIKPFLEKLFPKKSPFEK